MYIDKQSRRGHEVCVRPVDGAGRQECGHHQRRLHHTDNQVCVFCVCVFFCWCNYFGTLLYASLRLKIVPTEGAKQLYCQSFGFGNFSFGSIYSH